MTENIMTWVDKIESRITLKKDYSKEIEALTGYRESVSPIRKPKSAKPSPP